MFLVAEVVQNILMGIPPVARFAQRFHSTGLNADADRASQIFELYTRFVSVTGKDILEIGPGHTLEVLELARSKGAKTCTAIDVVAYLPTALGDERGIRYVLYKGRELPLEDAGYDVIWSYTAFEHLRYPRLMVEECFRVLRPGGVLVALIDLADHSFYGKQHPSPDKTFHCLHYSEWLWNLMRWNRSSYVNRLRQSDWLRLFRQAGFALLAREATVRDDIVEWLPQLKYLKQYSYEDAVTSVLTVCMEKPLGRAPHGPGRPGIMPFGEGDTYRA